MTRILTAIAPTALAFVIGIVGFLLLCNWAVCDPLDRVCLITGVPS
jgi:hypothetical protein